MTYQTLCALRIYLRRGDLSEATGFWRHLFRRPLATHLIQDALAGGIPHASLTYGNIGFAKGAKSLTANITEIGFDTLPVCVELVGPRPLLDQFVRDRKGQLEGATLVMLEGVHLHSMITEEGPRSADSAVEYVHVQPPREANVPAPHVHTILDALPEPTE